MPILSKCYCRNDFPETIPRSHRFGDEPGHPVTPPHHVHVRSVIHDCSRDARSPASVTNVSGKNTFLRIVSGLRILVNSDVRTEGDSLSRVDDKQSWSSGKTVCRSLGALTPTGRSNALHNEVLGILVNSAVRLSEHNIRLRKVRL